MSRTILTTVILSIVISVAFFTINDMKAVIVLFLGPLIGFGATFYISLISRDTSRFDRDMGNSGMLLTLYLPTLVFGEVLTQVPVVVLSVLMPLWGIFVVVNAFPMRD